jgi:hypothetical protein
VKQMSPRKRKKQAWMMRMLDAEMRLAAEAFGFDAPDTPSDEANAFYVGATAVASSLLYLPYHHVKLDPRADLYYADGITRQGTTDEKSPARVRHALAGMVETQRRGCYMSDPQNFMLAHFACETMSPLDPIGELRSQIEATKGLLKTNERAIDAVASELLKRRRLLEAEVQKIIDVSEGGE